MTTVTVDAPAQSMDHPPLKDGEIAIQRLPIHLPGFTSVTKFEPKYVVPLYKALWKFRDPKAPVYDSEDTVRVLDAYPVGISWREAWLVLDEAIALDYERQRLTAQFGKHPNGEMLFDIVYPGDTFDRAFEAALKPTKAVKIETSANPAIDEMATLDGIGQGLAKKLYERGIKSVKDIAVTGEADLEKIIGKTRAAKAKAAAEALFEAPETK